ncbi:GNAT family N-acetyltransferase [Flavivirga spongiicola]|uniref:GNAT family N-acetyltransferase n=1 Tax=Flavivirga spongiicola TaxID=421621 RepID=A0ABU7XXE9_9FLAO|nr:GNAT family N-acetyltransferase [Flavivirga sp. MEBiC05379]MDO5980466.1 GNAT family N-acetyltransferase [Flavivirga sp. MEBiC05379]
MSEPLDLKEQIFLLDKLPGFYKTLSSNSLNGFNYTNDDSNFKSPRNSFQVIKDIPEYFELEYKQLPKNIKHVTVEQYPGFSISFEGINDVNDYLKTRFGNSSRYKLRRSIKKLEASFDIKYKMYYGEMSKEEYDFIFKKFFRLLELRSIEKGILDNINIKRSDYFYKKFYPLILQKRASLFVIYNGDNPIDICLNYHNNSIVYQFIRTYDIAYSKFNTGYIDLIKQIEWCINNNIDFIDFSFGTYYWKKRWCNTSYKHNYHIFYNSKSLLSIIKSKVYVSKIKIKHVLRERGLIDKYHVKKQKLKNTIKPLKKTEIKISNIDFNVEVNIGDEINIYETEHHFIKKTVYDFLFNFNANEKDIKVYEVLDTSNKYLIIGNENKVIIDAIFNS